jgi:hypothetical protein
LVALLVAATSGVAAAQDLALSLELRPEGPLLDARVAQVVVRVTSKHKLQNAVLSLQPPPGFKCDPQSFALTGDTPITRVAALQRIDPDTASGRRALFVQLRDGAISTEELAPFQFQSSTLGTVSYLAYGLFGVVLGWLIKWSVKAFGALPVPEPARAAGVAPADTGRESVFFAFVRTHYFAVDLALSLTIGFLALLANLSGGAPPAGTQWTSAIPLGAGIGVLANNELVGRLGRR